LPAIATINAQLQGSNFSTSLLRGINYQSFGRLVIQHIKLRALNNSPITDHFDRTKKIAILG